METTKSAGWYCTKCDKMKSFSEFKPMHGEFCRASLTNTLFDWAYESEYEIPPRGNSFSEGCDGTQFEYKDAHKVPSFFSKFK